MTAKEALILIAIAAVCISGTAIWVNTMKEADTKLTISADANQPQTASSPDSLEGLREAYDNNDREVMVEIIEEMELQ